MDIPSPPLSFGQEHFGQAPLGHRARVQRLVRTADRIARHPGGTLPDKLRDPASYRGLMRLARHPTVTHEAVLFTHYRRTRDRMGQVPGVVLVLHDDTELDYTGKKSLTGLGQIGNGSRKGYICHNSLAYHVTGRQVLGLARQILHHREDVAKDETEQAKRERESRESLLWLRGREAIGAAPPGAVWVDVGDRGADTFEFLDYEVARGHSFVIRSQHDRTITLREPADPDASETTTTLHSYARSLRGKARRTVRVGGRDGCPSREAVVEVAWAKVWVWPPRKKRGQHRDLVLELWVVTAREVQAPVGVEAVEWFLLTNVAVASVDEAGARLDWYGSRWVVEEYHKAKKSGCGIELPQFTKEERLQPVIALLSVVAVMLLNLREQARQEGTRERPAVQAVPTVWVAVLSVWRYQRRRLDLTVWEFAQALGRLGGHQNRKGDGPPGWLVLWRGWEKLQDMVEYALAAGTEQDDSELAVDTGQR